MKTKKEEMKTKKVFARVMLLFMFQFSWLIGILVAHLLMSIGLSNFRILGFIVVFATIWFLTFGLIAFFGKAILSKSVIFLPFSCKSLKVSNFLYSPKIQKDVFEPIVSDWQEEHFEALFKEEMWKARWINVRYTYAFLIAMWQKSPIGDLIEFISKLAK